MNVPGFMVSQSFSNAGVTQLPSAPNLQAVDTAPDGRNRFKVDQWESYSYQVFLTGSNVNGTLYQGISNNLAAFIPYQSTPVAGTNVSQDILFAVPQNVSQFSKLYWSGSGGGQLTASVAFYGKEVRR